VLARKRTYDPRPRIAELLPSSDEAEGAPGAAPISSKLAGEP
jgi:hypothetical protein